MFIERRVGDAERRVALAPGKFHYSGSHAGRCQGVDDAGKIASLSRILLPRRDQFLVNQVTIPGEQAAEVGYRLFLGICVRVFE